MPSGSLILTIDQGTTSTRAIVFDESACLIGSAQQELRQIFPQSGWVEHDPVEIAEAAIGVARLALEDANATASDIVAMGITNQRETTVNLGTRDWTSALQTPSCGRTIAPPRYATV